MKRNNHAKSREKAFQAGKNSKYRCPVIGELMDGKVNENRT